MSTSRSANTKNAAGNNRSKFTAGGVGQAIVVCGLPRARPLRRHVTTLPLQASLILLIAGSLRSQPLRLDDLESMALAGHPSIAQAAAGIRSAAGRALQAGLYPNPVIGANGDEIATGPIIRGGELGGFFEQRIVTGGKLRLSRLAAGREKTLAEEAAAAERHRVLNAVRTLYYQALGDERRLKVREDLAKLAERSAAIARELANIGRADKPDVLAAEIEAHRMELSLAQARHSRERTWRLLSTAVGNPALEPQPLAGDLEELPALNLEEALAGIFRESPELRAAGADVERADLMVKRAEVEKIPDLMVRGGVRYNRELLEQSAQGGLRPVGREGFFDIGVRIPLFDRNQGAAASARADAERARLEVQRTKLSLRSRLAAAYKEYQDSMAMIETYRGRMIPKAREAHEMLMKNFQLMAAPYPEVLTAQRSLFQLQDDYIGALAGAWRAAVEIQGLLLTPAMR